jgi:hypothetical protein
VAVLVSVIVAIPAAQAQTVKWIRTTGSDANACTFSAPCRTLSRGVAAAPAGGEVRLQNSGDFGSGVTIAKSLTISGDGNTLALTGPVTINNTAVKVVLENLLFNGRGVTSIGVLINDAASVHLVGCKVERFTGTGIGLNSITAVTELFVTDSISRNNGGDGMNIDGNSLARVTVDNSHFENNSTGLVLFNATASITRSTSSGNTYAGISQSGGASSIAWTLAADNGNVSSAGFFVFNGGVMQLESSVTRGHTHGIDVSNSVAIISNVTVTKNDVGVFNAGTVRTFGNNKVFGNTTETFGNAFAATLTQM